MVIFTCLRRHCENIISDNFEAYYSHLKQHQFTSQEFFELIKYQKKSKSTDFQILWGHFFKKYNGFVCPVKNCCFFANRESDIRVHYSRSCEGFKKSASLTTCSVCGCYIQTGDLISHKHVHSFMRVMGVDKEFSRVSCISTENSKNDGSDDVLKSVVEKIEEPANNIDARESNPCLTGTKWKISSRCYKPKATLLTNGCSEDSQLSDDEITPMKHLRKHIYGKSNNVAVWPWKLWLMELCRNKTISCVNKHCKHRSLDVLEHRDHMRECISNNSKSSSNGLYCISCDATFANANLMRAHMEFSHTTVSACQNILSHETQVDFLKTILLPRDDTSHYASKYEFKILNCFSKKRDIIAEPELNMENSVEIVDCAGENLKNTIAALVNDCYFDTPSVPLLATFSYDYSDEYMEYEDEIEHTTKANESKYQLQLHESTNELQLHESKNKSQLHETKNKSQLHESTSELKVHVSMNEPQNYPSASPLKKINLDNVPVIIQLHSSSKEENNRIRRKINSSMISGNVVKDVKIKVTRKGVEKSNESAETAVTKQKNQSRVPIEKNQPTKKSLQKPSEKISVDSIKPANVTPISKLVNGATENVARSMIKDRKGEAIEKLIENKHFKADSNCNKTKVHNMGIVFAPRKLRSMINVKRINGIICDKSDTSTKYVKEKSKAAHLGGKKVNAKCNRNSRKTRNEVTRAQPILDASVRNQKDYKSAKDVPEVHRKSTDKCMTAQSSKQIRRSDINVENIIYTARASTKKLEINSDEVRKVKNNKRKDDRRNVAQLKINKLKPVINVNEVKDLGSTGDSGSIISPNVATKCDRAESKEIVTILYDSSKENSDDFTLPKSKSCDIESPVIKDKVIEIFEKSDVNIRHLEGKRPCSSDIDIEVINDELSRINIQKIDSLRVFDKSGLKENNTITAGIEGISSVGKFTVSSDKVPFLKNLNEEFKNEEAIPNVAERNRKIFVNSSIADCLNENISDIDNVMETVTSCISSFKNQRTLCAKDVCRVIDAIAENACLNNEIEKTVGKSNKLNDGRCLSIGKEKSNDVGVIYNKEISIDTSISLTENAENGDRGTKSDILSTDSNLIAPGNDSDENNVDDIRSCQKTANDISDVNEESANNFIDADMVTKIDNTSGIPSIIDESSDEYINNSVSGDVAIVVSDIISNARVDAIKVSEETAVSLNASIGDTGITGDNNSSSEKCLGDKSIDQNNVRNAVFADKFVTNTSNDMDNISYIDKTGIGNILDVASDVENLISNGVANEIESTDALDIDKMADKKLIEDIADTSNNILDVTSFMPIEECVNVNGINPRDDLNLDTNTTNETADEDHIEDVCEDIVDNNPDTSNNIGSTSDIDAVNIRNVLVIASDTKIKVNEISSSDDVDPGINVTGKTADAEYIDDTCGTSNNVRSSSDFDNIGIKNVIDTTSDVTSEACDSPNSNFDSDKNVSDKMADEDHFDDTCEDVADNIIQARGTVIRDLKGMESVGNISNDESNVIKDLEIDTNITHCEESTNDNIGINGDHDANIVYTNISIDESSTSRVNEAINYLRNTSSVQTNTKEKESICDNFINVENIGDTDSKNTFANVEFGGDISGIGSIIISPCEARTAKKSVSSIVINQDNVKSNTEDSNRKLTSREKVLGLDESNDSNSPKIFTKHINGYRLTNESASNVASDENEKYVIRKNVGNEIVDKTDGDIIFSVLADSIPTGEDLSFLPKDRALIAKNSVRNEGKIRDNNFENKSFPTKKIKRNRRYESTPNSNLGSGMETSFSTKIRDVDVEVNEQTSSAPISSSVVNENSCSTHVAENDISPTDNCDSNEVFECDDNRDNSLELFTRGVKKDINSSKAKIFENAISNTDISAESDKHSDRRNFTCQKATPYVVFDQGNENFNGIISDSDENNQNNIGCNLILSDQSHDDSFVQTNEKSENNSIKRENQSESINENDFSPNDDTSSLRERTTDIETKSDLSRGLSSEIDHSTKVHDNLGAVNQTDSLVVDENEKSRNSVLESSYVPNLISELDNFAEVNDDIVIDYEFENSSEEESIATVPKSSSLCSPTLGIENPTKVNDTVRRNSESLELGNSIPESSFLTRLTSEIENAIVVNDKITVDRESESSDRGSSSICSLASVTENATNVNDDVTVYYELENLDFEKFIPESSTTRGDTLEIESSTKVNNDFAVHYKSESLTVEELEKFIPESTSVCNGTSENENLIVLNYVDVVEFGSDNLLAEEGDESQNLSLENHAYVSNTKNEVIVADNLKSESANDRNVFQDIDSNISIPIDNNQFQDGKEIVADNVEFHKSMPTDFNRFEGVKKTVDDVECQNLIPNQVNHLEDVKEIGVENVRSRVTNSVTKFSVTVRTEADSTMIDPSPKIKRKRGRPRKTPAEILPATDGISESNECDLKRDVSNNMKIIPRDCKESSDLCLVSSASNPLKGIAKRKRKRKNEECAETESGDGISEALIKTYAEKSFERDDNVDVKSENLSSKLKVENESKFEQLEKSEVVNMDREKNDEDLNVTKGNRSGNLVSEASKPLSPGIRKNGRGRWKKSLEVDNAEIEVQFNLTPDNSKNASINNFGEMSVLEYRDEIRKNNKIKKRKIGSAKKSDEIVSVFENDEIYCDGERKSTEKVKESPLENEDTLSQCIGISSTIKKKKMAKRSVEENLLGNNETEKSSREIKKKGRPKKVSSRPNELTCDAASASDGSSARKSGIKNKSSVTSADEIQENCDTLPVRRKIGRPRKLLPPVEHRESSIDIEDASKYNIIQIDEYQWVEDDAGGSVELPECGDFPLTPHQVDRNSIPYQNPKEVICGRCDKRMSLAYYKLIHRNQHYYICWLRDEEPITFEDENEAKKIIRTQLEGYVRDKKVKHITCDRCAKSYYTVDLYIRHLMFCQEENDSSEGDVQQNVLPSNTEKYSMWRDERLKSDTKKTVAKKMDTEKPDTKKMDTKKSESLPPVKKKGRGRVLAKSATADESHKSVAETSDVPQYEITRIDEYKWVENDGNPVKMSVNEEFPLTPHQIDRNSMPYLNPKEVTCGRCNNRMSLAYYKLIHRSHHYYISWLTTEESIVFDNEDEIKQIIKDTLTSYQELRKVKDIFCSRCRERWWTVEQYIAHLQTCKEVQENDVLEENDTPEIQNFDNLDIRRPRISAAKARKSWAALTDQGSDEEVKEKKVRSSNHENWLIRMYFKEKLILWREFEYECKDFWNEKLLNCEPILCIKKDCQFTAHTIDEMEIHLSACDKKADVYRCKKCSQKALLLANMRAHVKGHFREKRKSMSLSGECLRSKKKKTDSSSESYGSSSSEEDCPETDDDLAEYEVTSSYKTVWRYHVKKIDAAKKMREKYHSKSLLHEKLVRGNEGCRILSDEEKKEYLPKCETSMPVMKPTGGEKSYTLFESSVEDGTPTLFVGGPVSAISWLPAPNNIRHQILAVASHPDMDCALTDAKIHSFKSVVTLWRMDLTSETKPEMIYVVAHNFGAIWAMEWCPSGCYDESANQLGLLALATSSSFIPIYSIPITPSTTGNDAKVTLMEPALILKNTGRRYQCTRLCWDKCKPHANIYAGFTNGLIAKWNIDNEFLAVRDKNVAWPVKTFHAHEESIVAIDLHWMGSSNFLLSASVEGAVKIWDLSNSDAYPVHDASNNFPLTDARFMTNWMTYVLTFSDKKAGEYYVKYCSGSDGQMVYAQNVSGSHNCVSISNWTDSTAISTMSGCTLLKKIHSHKGLPPKEHHSMAVLSDTTLVKKSDGRIEGKINSGEEPPSLFTYDSVKHRYSIKFSLAKAGKALKVDSLKDEIITEYPTISVNKVCWNQNANYFEWLAIGHQSGFIHLVNVANQNAK